MGCLNPSHDFLHSKMSDLLDLLLGYRKNYFTFFQFQLWGECLINRIQNWHVQKTKQSLGSKPALFACHLSIFDDGFYHIAYAFLGLNHDFTLLGLKFIHEWQIMCSVFDFFLPLYWHAGSEIISCTTPRMMCKVKVHVQWNMACKTLWSHFVYCGHILYILVVIL